MKIAPEQLPAFIDGVIIALDHRIGIAVDKDLTWTVGTTQGITQAFTVITFKWVEFWTVDDEEPHFTDDCIYLDGSESASKIVRDIEDMLERIDGMEVEHKSKAEMLADAYFEH